MDPFTQRMLKRASSSKAKEQLRNVTIRKTDALSILHARHEDTLCGVGSYRSLCQGFNSTLQGDDNVNSTGVALRHTTCNTGFDSEELNQLQCETSLSSVSEDKFSSSNTGIFHATFVNSMTHDDDDDDDDACNGNADNSMYTEHSVGSKYCESCLENNCEIGHVILNINHSTLTSLIQSPFNSKIVLNNCGRSSEYTNSDSRSLIESCKEYLYEEDSWNINTEPLINTIESYALGSPSDVEMRIRKETPVACDEWESEEQDSDEIFYQELSSDVYDMDKFLEEALGDELLNCSSSESQFNSTMNCHSLTKRPEDNLYHTVSHYRSLTQVARQKIRSPLPATEPLILEQSPFTEAQKKQTTIQVLLKEVSRQITVMSQTSKALDLCLTSKKVIGSSQHVECERILLLSFNKHQALMDEIHHLRFEEQSGDGLHMECGNVQISNLSLLMKIGETPPATSKSAGSNMWLVCLLSHREIVIATQAMCLVQDGRINFPGSYSFHHLDNDFVITLQVYSLKLGNTSNSVMKHMLYKNTKTVLMCTSPCKLIRCRSEPELECIPNEICAHTSSFVLEGMLHLQRQDLFNNTFWNLNKVPLSAVVSGTLDMILNSSVKLTIQCSSFLTMYEEAGGLAAWHRQWYYLSDHTLKYWNYPTDMDSKDPYGQVDLLTCVTRRVEPVDRSQCARARTFLLETRSQTSNLQTAAVIRTRYLLSADTVAEMDQWCLVLNQVLSVLRDWHLIPDDESS